MVEPKRELRTVKNCVSPTLRVFHISSPKVALIMTNWSSRPDPLCICITWLVYWLDVDVTSITFLEVDAQRHGHLHNAARIILRPGKIWCRLPLGLGPALRALGHEREGKKEQPWKKHAEFIQPERRKSLLKKLKKDSCSLMHTYKHRT